MSKITISESELNNIIYEHIDYLIQEGILGNMFAGAARLYGGARQGLNMIRDRWNRGVAAGANWMRSRYPSFDPYGGMSDKNREMATSTSPADYARFSYQDAIANKFGGPQPNPDLAGTKKAPKTTATVKPKTTATAKPKTTATAKPSANKKPAVKKAVKESVDKKIRLDENQFKGLVENIIKNSILNLLNEVQGYHDDYYGGYDPDYQIQSVLEHLNIFNNKRYTVVTFEHMPDGKTYKYENGDISKEDVESYIEKMKNKICAISIADYKDEVIVHIGPEEHKQDILNYGKQFNK